MTRPNDEPKTQPAARSRGLKFKLAALGLTLVSALAGTGLCHWLKTPPAEEPKKPGLFEKWGKPDLVVVLTGQQHGYLLPCGCSDPQIGGLERRYNFMQQLKQRGWPVVAVDLGDVPQKQGPAKLPNVQGLIKYRYAMRAMKEMNYLGVGVGEFETALSLGKVEGEWALNETRPAVLAANLEEPANFPGLQPFVVASVPGTNLSVGVTSVVGPTVADAVKDPGVKFRVGKPPHSTADVLREQLKAMQERKVDLPILLYHGFATPRKDDGIKEAVRAAEAFPQFPVVVCLSEEGADTAKAFPIPVKHPETQSISYVFELGHKGKSVGVLGVYRNGPSAPALSFKYQVVEMGLDYATPPDKADGHPIVKLMEDYTNELKKENYLRLFGQSSHIVQAMAPVAGLKNPGDGMPHYVGSEACKKCHEHAYDVWKHSDHAHAYKTLVEKARRPSNRQYDAECIVCHTVGFGYKTGFTDAVKTPQLENVGCESCHGPASLHVKNPNNEEWRARMNQEWRGAKNKTLAIDTFCQKCHDQENDVHWMHGAFEKTKWPKIIHTTP